MLCLPFNSQQVACKCILRLLCVLMILYAHQFYPKILYQLGSVFPDQWYNKRGHIPLALSHFRCLQPSISSLFHIQVLNAMSYRQGLYVAQCLVKHCRGDVDDIVHNGWCGGVYWDFLVVHFVYYFVIVYQLVLSKESHTSLEVCSQASCIQSRAAPCGAYLISAVRSSGSTAPNLLLWLPFKVFIATHVFVSRRQAHLRNIWCLYIA